MTIRWRGLENSLKAAVLTVTVYYKDMIKVSQQKKCKGPRKCHQKAARLGQVCSGAIWSMWVLDLRQERFCNTSPGDFESMFIKAGTVK